MYKKPTQLARSNNIKRDIRVVLDNNSYESGSLVRFRVLPEERPAAAEPLQRLDLTATIFRLGRSEPIAAEEITYLAAPSDSAEYRVAWHIPDEAPTGRYSITIAAHDSTSGRWLWNSKAATFAIWRSEVSIEHFDADRRFYAPGDPISLTLTLANKTDKPWTDLSVEVAESQYPWISVPRGTQPNPAFTYPVPISLEPGESRVLTVGAFIDRAATSGSLHYTVVVRASRSGPSRLRTSAMSRIVAFRTSPAVFVRNPAVPDTIVYPAAYIHSDLSQVRVDGYRAFYPPHQSEFSFGENRTSYPAGQRVTVRMKVDSRQPLRGAVLELRNSRGESIDGAPARVKGDSLHADLQFGPPGLYEIVARATGRNGRLRNVGSLEVAANVLPRSLAIVCAHPDDEFLHPGAIRAAVENAIPVHLIFLTNGDAGGSDRFFGPNYKPAEAIEFGHIRMAEARAAALHLGIPEANLHFLGLPDGFLEAIRLEQRACPVFSPLLGTEYSPYCCLEQPNLPFDRESVLKVLTRLLGEIKPDTIYTSHPDERHKDHRAAAWFTIEALQQLLASGRLDSAPTLRSDAFYGPDHEVPAPFSYSTHELFSSGEAMARVQEAYWFYQTQGGNHARGHVLAYADLPRVERHYEILDWRLQSLLPGQLDLPATA